MAAHPHLALHILELFGKGELSASQVRGIAAAALDDGWGQGSQLAARLATLGGKEAQQTGHMVRDLITAARGAKLMMTGPKPYNIGLPAVAGTAAKTVMIFLPHEIYACMVPEDGLAQWCLSQEALDAQSGLGPLLKRWAGHDDVRFEGDLTTVGMLGMHCDGVSYNTTMRAGGSKGVLVASLNCISAANDGLKRKRHPLFVLQKDKLCDCGCSGYHTLQDIFEGVSWSMR